MALLTLNDEELEDLIFTIISPHMAAHVLELVKDAPGNIERPDSPGDKRLGYKDYKLQIRNFKNQDGHVTDAVVQIWRPSRFFGWRDNKHLLNILKKAASRRYEVIGRTHGVRLLTHSSLFMPIEFTWRGETRIIYEAKSQGQADCGPYKDFIILKFHRMFD